MAGEAPNYSSETVDGAWMAIENWIAERLFNRAFAAAGEVAAALDEGVRGHRMAKAALEMAAWDLEARSRVSRCPRLLGGERERVATGISIGLQDEVAKLIGKIEAAVAEGYHRIKLKIAPGRDLDWLRAVRDTFGAELPLSVDANAAYGLADMETLRGMDDLGLLMIEQPLAPGDLMRHARLQRQLRTPICLDESITSVENVEDMIELGAGRIVNIKPGRVGGLSSSRRIHDLCLASDIPVWCGGMLESGIGRAHNVALASLPGFSLPGDLSPSARYWAEDIVEPPWVMDDEGSVRVPRDLPGIGVEIRIDLIDELCRRESRIRPDRS